MTVADNKYSVVIPVFNSEQTIGKVIDRIAAFFYQQHLKFEIVLVNDGSTDNSWEIVRSMSVKFPEITAIDLLRNYGQHVANLCGFRHAKGDYVITMDDDLQNPPEEIGKLIAKADEGYDLVIGRYEEKRHSLVRRVGSKIVGQMIAKIFHQSNNLSLTNFRIIRRDVIERTCNFKTSYPYIPGLVLLLSAKKANVIVQHNDRESGRSNYNARRIAKLIAELLFNYSSYPLRVTAGVGLVAALLSFSLSVFYFSIAIFHGTSVPGWATVVVLLSFFNGMTLFVLGIVGEYLVRLMNQISHAELYHVKEIIQK